MVLVLVPYLEPNLWNLQVPHHLKHEPCLQTSSVFGPGCFLYKRPICALYDFIAVAGGGSGGGVGIPLTGGGFQGHKAFCSVSSTHFRSTMYTVIYIYIKKKKMKCISALIKVSSSTRYRRWFGKLSNISSLIWRCCAHQLRMTHVEGEWAFCPVLKVTVGHYDIIALNFLDRKWCWPSVWQMQAPAGALMEQRCWLQSCVLCDRPVDISLCSRC